LLLVIATVLGAFTWPSLVYIGVVFLVFPRENMVEQETSLPRWFAAGLTAFVSLGVIALCYVRHDHFGSPVDPMRIALPLSIVLCLLYLYYGSSVLLHGVSARTFQSSSTLLRAAIGAVLFVAVKIPGHLWADRTKHAISMGGTIGATMGRSIVRPLCFLVAHTVYFGPVFLLFLFYWKPFSRIIRNHGLGLTLATWMGVFISINSESRQNLPSYVIAVPFLGLLVQKLALPARFFWLIGGLALVFSKVWMRMNLPAYSDISQHQPFPFQNLFMHMGPWMSNRMYLLQAAMVLAAAALLYASVSNAQRKLA
jgi:hypothetical protein